MAGKDHPEALTKKEIYITIVSFLTAAPFLLGSFCLPPILVYFHIELGYPAFLLGLFGVYLGFSILLFVTPIKKILSIYHKLLLPPIFTLIMSVLFIIFAATSMK